MGLPSLFLPCFLAYSPFLFRYKESWFPVISSFVLKSLYSEEQYSISYQESKSLELKKSGSSAGSPTYLLWLVTLGILPNPPKHVSSSVS